jgi:stage II sporulation protein D
MIAVRQAGQVVSIRLEDYVLGSVMAEVSPIDQPPDAVERIFEVQAVLARTYAADHLGKHRAEGFDLCDTTHCQLYDPNRLRTSRFAADARGAVRRTAGLVLTYQGHLAEGLYHADCGGYTAAADAVWGGAAVPYLIAAPDDSPPVAHRKWQVSVPVDQLRTLLNTNTRTEVGRTFDRIEVLTQDAGGHVMRMTVAGEHAHDLRGEEFRSILNQGLGPRAIQSTLFTVTRSRGDVVFSGAGFGHGVGLCQAGAAARARQGDPVERILAHYFPGVRLTRG